MESTTSLARILDSTELTQVISELDARSIAMLLEDVGLEDASELIALMSSEQIATVLDDDLWTTNESESESRSKSKSDFESGPSFDPARFALWLELMQELDDSVLVQHLSRLDEDLLVYGFYRLVIVLSLDELALTAQVRSREDMRRIEDALEACPSQDIGGFLVVGRMLETFGPALHALLTLDAEDHGLSMRILDRCWALALDATDEENDLFDVLTSQEMAEQDALEDRNVRRRSRGFISKDEADAFLAVVRRTPLDAMTDQPGASLFARYRGQLEPTAVAPAAWLAQRLQSFIKAKGRATLRRRLPDAIQRSRFEMTMERLKAQDPNQYELFAEQLAFLGNVLLGADDRQRPADAAREVMRLIAFGVEHLGPTAYRDQTPIHLFQIGLRRQQNADDAP